MNNPPHLTTSDTFSPVIIVMGVTGSGKTTIGELVAKKMNLDFYDADDFHPAANQKKLAHDIPLDDEDRLPWLAELAVNITKWSNADGAVLACSALKHAYRKIFRQASPSCRFVFLDGSPHLIAKRLRHRADVGEHIISDFEDILRGQYRDLEIPTDALIACIDQSPDEIVKDILNAISDRVNTPNPT